MKPPGRVPLEDDDVLIEAGWNMIYDVPLADTVKVKMLQIDGQLSFKDDQDMALKAEHIFVQSGNLFVGA